LTRTPSGSIPASFALATPRDSSKDLCAAATPGLYAHKRREEQERCRDLLGGQPLPLDDDELDGEIPEDERPLARPEEFCKVCGLELVVLEVIPRTTRPPPEKLYGRLA